jgi:WD40 repeat protein
LENLSELEFQLLISADQPIAGLAWDSCCPLLRVFQRDGSQLLIDTARKQTVAEDRVTPGFGDVRQLEWSPCRRFAAVLREDHVDIWNTRKGKWVTSPPEWGKVGRITWRPKPVNSEGQLSIATASGLILWSAEGDFDRRFPQPLSVPTALSWDPTGTWVAVACGGLRVWNARTGAHILLPTDALHELAWDAHGDWLAGASAQSLFAWNMRAAIHGRLDAQWVCHLDSPISRMAFRPGGNILAAGTIHGYVQLRRPAAVSGIVRSAGLGAAVTQLAWSANGKQLAAATSRCNAYTARVCR